MKKYLDPTKLNIKVERLNFGPKNIVIIEAFNIESSAISKSLEKSDLEIKPDVEMNPRLLIYDVPAELVKEDIVKCIIGQNIRDNGAVKI